MGQHTTTRAHTIRLKNEVWDAIEEQASALGMSRNEIVARRLASFCRVPDNHKTVETLRNPADLEVVDLQ